MDIPRLDALRTYHTVNPSVHLSVARYLGYGESEKKMSDKDLDDVMSMFPQI
jgi:hypothetical protein